ncbi:MAG: outer membrane protein assembly factor BamA [Alphaproteobacteria bacterium]|jgi:outer membrane protein insertion porin family|nr:outer membrane protein assembly factor BamA [Alphaproteobacteria bacterium]
MQRSRARSAALASGFALLLSSTALTAPTVALAQAQAEVVQRIAVRGNERIEQATVLSYLPIQPGDRVDAAQLDLALKALYRTDLFADVRISAVGGEVIVEVVENPIINRVIFEGNRGLKEDKLRDEVTLRPRGIFTRARIQQDVQRIVELYRRSGRISANVTPKIVELPQKRVDVIFEIDEGAKSGVLRTNFIGNVEFSDNDLRDVVVTEQSAWYKLFSSNANYDPDRLEYDKEQLREHYRNRGFYDFRVVSAIAELSPDKNGFVVTYTVEEGPEYKFGNVEVATELEKLNKETLVQILPIREGQIYQDERIEQATDTLTFAAGAAGFAFVDVRPRYTPNRETRTVDVTFQVNEGPRVYVERIDIIGNTRTLDYVVRREMNLAEGDAYNRVLVDRSRNRIRALGFFKDVTIEEVPGSAPDRTGLQVQVEEQPTGELSFSAGYSSVDQLILDLGVTERNFRGRGQNVRARVSVGSLRQQVDFSFTEPRFMGRDLGAGVDLYSYRYDLTDYSAYRTNTIGGGVRLGFPLTLNARASARYTLRRDEVEIPASFCDPNAAVVSISLCQQRGAYTTSLVGYGVRLDRRNDPINPTRGFYTALNQDLAGLGGDVNYLKTEIEGGIYYGFSPSFILSGTGSAGYVDGWNGDTVRINERFYKGGNSFRGFETAGIGARDLNSARGDALGGKAYAIGSVELTVPTFLPEQYGVKAALFSDFGTLGMLDDEDKLTVAGAVDPNIVDDLSLRASAGVSIFWRSPMGPIRFDFSQVLAKEDYDKTETFRFSTSTRF